MFRYTNPKNTKEYDKANVVLHSKLATIAWPLALREKKVINYDLPAKLHKDASRQIVTLSFEVSHCHDIAGMRTPFSVQESARSASDVGSMVLWAV